MEKLTPGEGPIEKPTDSPEKPRIEKALVFENGQERTYDDAEKFFERFGVHKWVRFTAEEMDAVDPESEYIDHFNLKETNSEVGKKYIVMRILRNGVRSPDPQQAIPPLLSLDGAFIVECVEVENSVPYDALPERYFEYSLKGMGIIDRTSLKEAVLKKYRKGMPALTDEQVEKDGVAHTRLKFIEKVQN